MQPTGRAVPNSVRALLAAGDQRNLELCGRGLEGLQLICKSLGSGRSPLSAGGLSFGGEWRGVDQGET
jgi:hypothetical protein